MSERKVIRIPNVPEDTPGAVWSLPVIVDWFPPLTMDQHVANAAARADGKPDPFPDPNLITIEIERGKALRPTDFGSDDT